MVSRDAWPVEKEKAPTTYREGGGRSMPMPMPPDGGKPCSMAEKSSSAPAIAQGLMAAATLKPQASRWTTGSASSGVSGGSLSRARRGPTSRSGPALRW